MPSSGILRRVVLVSADVSEERSASIIRMARIGELGKLTVTSNYSISCQPDDGGDIFLRNFDCCKSHTEKILEDGILLNRRLSHIKRQRPIQEK
jgi:hypothetical protein